MTIPRAVNRAALTWLAAGSMLATTLLFLALLGVSTYANYQDFHREHAERANDLGRALAAHIESVLTAIEGDLRGIVQMIRDDPSRMTQADPRTARHLRAQKTWNTSIGAINVFDAAGILVGSSVPDAALGTPLGPSARFTRFRGEPSDELMISEPLQSAMLGQTAFSVTLGAYDHDGYFLGMVGALVPISTFLDVFMALKPSPASRIIVHRTDGVVLVRSMQLTAEEAQQANSERMRQLIADSARRGEALTRSPLDGAPLVSSLHRLQRFALVAVVAVTRSEIDAAWLAANRGNLIAHATLVVLAVAMNVAFLVMLRRRERSSDEEHRLLEDEQRRALANSESRFRDGIESMPLGFALWDSGDRLVAWNSAYAGLFTALAPSLRPGIAYRELLDIAVTRDYPDWDAATRQRHIEERLAKRGSSSRVALRTADGRMIETTERRTAEGGVVCLFDDVTQARRVADRLAASDALFRDGIEAMHDGFVLLDAADRVAAWNSAFCEMFPQLSEEIRVGLSFADLVRVDLAASAAGDPSLDIEERFAARMRHHTGDGEAVELRSAVPGRRIVATERRTSSGAMVIVYRDETELRRAQANLNATLDQLRASLDAEREMTAQQRRFISIASHEFRTPLAIVDGAAQRLAAQIGAAGPEIRKRIDRIRSAVRRMAELMEATLSSSRVDEGRIAVDPMPFDLAALVNDVVARHRMLSPAFAFDVAISEAPATIEADARLIDQVLTNLLSNAVKYSGDSRRIEVRVAVGAEEAAIDVRDFGIGVAADEVDKLFTRFFRARTASGIAGTGIGLHLVRELVRLHGGTVAVRSTLGDGSTFTVHLPRRRSDAQRAA